MSSKNTRHGYAETQRSSGSRATRLTEGNLAALNQGESSRHHAENPSRQQTRNNVNEYPPPQSGRSKAPSMASSRIETIRTEISQSGFPPPPSRAETVRERGPPSSSFISRAKSTLSRRPSVSRNEHTEAPGQSGRRSSVSTIKPSQGCPPSSSGQSRRSSFSRGRGDHMQYAPSAGGQSRRSAVTQTRDTQPQPYDQTPRSSPSRALVPTSGESQMQMTPYGGQNAIMPMPPPFTANSALDQRLESIDRKLESLEKKAKSIQRVPVRGYIRKKGGISIHIW